MHDRPEQQLGSLVLSLRQREDPGQLGFHGAKAETGVGQPPPGQHAGQRREHMHPEMAHRVGG
ncbi:MAG: hypothetical protein ACRDRT_10870, partial [Pseudonocardiaceae bacterium]